MTGTTPQPLRRVVAAFARNGAQVVAVCDDGTAWALSEHGDVAKAEWRQISPVVPGATLGRR